MSSSEEHRFPVAHLRHTLDEQFSFRSDCSEVPFSNNAEPALESGLQCVVATEKWFQVPCLGSSSPPVQLCCTKH